MRHFRVVDSLNPSVAPASENLMVVANLFLQPPIAYVMPGAQLQYSATQYRGSRMSRLTLPSASHQLAVDDKLASLNQGNSTQSISIFNEVFMYQSINRIKFIYLENVTRIYKTALMEV